MGQTSLVDVDKDGDLDWIAGCSGGDLWWFEYKGPDEWVMHTVGHKAATDVGGTAFDVNGDGDNDVVRTDTWFENADGKGKRWVAHKNIDFGQADARWPLMTKSWVVDLDGDGDNDVVQAEGDCLSGRVGALAADDEILGGRSRRGRRQRRGAGRGRLPQRPGGVAREQRR